MEQAFQFSEIEQHVPPGAPGVYVISTVTGVPLKAGISGDVLRRLKDHRASRQSGLVLAAGGAWSNPADVESKKSILAKHLYFDEELAPEYDLKSEEGRRTFLEERCVIKVELTDTPEQAREIERGLEASGRFRYQGPVLTRSPAELQRDSAGRRWALPLIVVALLVVVALLRMLSHG